MEIGGPQPDKGPISPQEIENFRQALFQCTPRTVVTWTFLGLNLFVYALMGWRGVHWWNPASNDLISWGANFGPRTLDGEWWRLFSSVFIHVGLLHLLLNMYVLWMAGRLVERLLGNAGFLVMVLSAGAGGSLASLAWNPVAVSAGASGAIFGIFGALLGILLRGKWTLPRGIRKTVGRDALIFLGYNLLGGLFQPHIDLAAHMGGLAAGFFCGLVLARPLTPEGVRSGNRLSLALVLGSVLAFTGVYQALPKDITRYDQEMARFSSLDRKSLTLFYQTWQQAQKGDISDAAFADILNRKILPEWKAEQKALQSLKRLPLPLQKKVDLTLRYLALREESWELLARALQKKDLNLLGQSAAKSREAEAIRQILTLPQPTHLKKP